MALPLSRLTYSSSGDHIDFANVIRCETPPYQVPSPSLLHPETTTPLSTSWGETSPIPLKDRIKVLSAEVLFDRAERLSCSYPTLLSHSLAYLIELEEKDPEELSRLASDIFDLVEKNSNHLCGDQNIGQNIFNKYKNRWPNILPFDNQLLHFENTPTYKDSDDSDTYLNGSAMGKRFIATQAPLLETLPAHFRMIDDLGVRTIFVLGNVLDLNNIKMFDYWNMAQPLKDQYSVAEPIAYEKDGLSEVIASAILDGKVQTLVLQRLKVNGRPVNLYHFQDWPDFGVPEISLFLKALNLIPHDNSPVVVHCSAGIGRSGTFIATELLRNNEVINLAEVILKLRSARKGMVQKTGQVLAILKALIAIAKEKR